MKRMIILFSLLFVVHSYSYTQTATKVDKEKVANEIRLMESAFKDDLKRYGVEHAFYTYAAENAVIKRENDSLIIGKLAIKNYYANPVYKNAVAEWSPDFIDVSEDGSMAYTYG